VNEPFNPSSNWKDRRSWYEVEEGEVVEPGPAGLNRVRWTKSVGKHVVHRTSVNRAMNSYEPILVLFGPEVYETEPTELYVALEQLPLEGASDEALRAYATFREIVLFDIQRAAHNAIHDALDAD
jgi:hypothetical protein